MYMHLVSIITINFKESNRSFPELRLPGSEISGIGIGIELELELKLIVSSGIGIGIENNGIGIELKIWNWPQPWWEIRYFVTPSLIGWAQT